jgi:hypothetical protein
MRIGSSSYSGPASCVRAFEEEIDQPQIVLHD